MGFFRVAIRSPRILTNVSLTVVLISLSCGFSYEAHADAFLADWCFSGSCNGGPAAGGPANPPGFDASHFDTTLEPNSNTLGYYSITLGAGANQYAVAYMDYDLNFLQTGSFSDYGKVVCSASIWMGTATIRMAISAVALRG